MSAMGGNRMFRRNLTQSIVWQPLLVGDSESGGGNNECLSRRPSFQRTAQLLRFGILVLYASALKGEWHD